MMACEKKRVCIIGSGNWGSTIAKIVGENVVAHSDSFEAEVRMWVFEEMVEGGTKKLTEVINERHENVKYLPGIKLPENVVAVPDIVNAATDADILVFVIPHQFIERSCKPLVGKLKAGAEGISLIKGFAIVPTGGIKLMSNIIADMFNGMSVSVLMGANLAGEVAKGAFCETTVGCHNLDTSGKVYKSLFQTPNFRVSVVNDVKTVEICGALKNIVACGAGFVDGMKCGDNTKAAVIRIGLMEMIKYCNEHHREASAAAGGDFPRLSTFFESCGVADLITTCYGGRNRRVSEAFVTTGKSLSELEAEMLGGQKLQGPETAAEVNFMLKQKGLEDQFPLFTAVHKICQGQMKVEEFIDQLRSHPIHENPDYYSSHL